MGRIRAWAGRRSTGGRAALVGVALVVAAVAAVAATASGILGPPADPTTAPPSGLSALPPAAQPPAPGPALAGELRTVESQIVDAQDKPVRLTGITWWGGEVPGSFSPRGLATRTWTSIIDQVAGLGYNTLRLPYSDAMLLPTAAVGGIDPGRNPDLVGLTPLQVFDKIITYAGTRGMRVILARENFAASSTTGLWYDTAASDADWIANWTLLAKHYAGSTTVIGADLSNEPWNTDTDGACWGCGIVERDWRLAAERAGAAIQQVSPRWLIFVQGVNKTPGSGFGWRGGNLAGVAQFPVRLPVAGKLVYTAHDFGLATYKQQWLTSPEFPGNLTAFWDQQWGYLTRSKTAPVMLGGFGSDLKDPRDVVWMQSLLAYLGRGPTGTSFVYFALNPDQDQVGGILKDDWTTVDRRKQDLLQPYL
jgi:endoglucanase